MTLISFTRLAAAGIASLATMASVQTVYADFLVFGNGDKLSGTYLREEGDIIYFESEMMGQVQVAASLAEVELTQDIVELAPQVALVENDVPGNPVNAAQPVESGAPAEDVADSVEQTVDIAQQEEQPSSPEGQFLSPEFKSAMDKFLTRIQEFKLLENWDSKFDIGFTWQQDAKRKQDIFLKLGTQRDIGSDAEIKLEAQYDYGSQEDKDGNSSVSIDRLRSNLRYRDDWNGDALFFQSWSSYLADRVKDVRLRVDQSFGIGWRFFETNQIKASVTPSITGQFSRFDDQDEHFDLRLSLYQDFRYKFNGRVSIHQKSGFTVDPNDIESYIMEFEARLESKITDTLSMDLRAEIDYDEVNPVAKSNSRQRYILTFGYIF